IWVSSVSTSPTVIWVNSVSTSHNRDRTKNFSFEGRTVQQLGHPTVGYSD
ncbi:hypothetical protein BgiBS90_014337, partial [Biomphalaria glabrata]